MTIYRPLCTHLLRLGLLALAIGSISCSSTKAQQPIAQHPLDPLSANEISVATSILHDAGKMQPSVRFVVLEAEEPDKASVAEQLAAGIVRRVARAVLYDWTNGATSEAHVDLRARSVISTTDLGVGEPPVRHVMTSRAGEIAMADARVIQALKRHGITKLDRLSFVLGLPEGTRPERRGNARLVNAVPYLWDETGELAVIPGLSVLVDLAGGVVEGVADSAPTPSPVAAKTSGSPPTLKPLHITQPDGPSFRIAGSEIKWDRWRIHYAIHARRGLEVFDVSYQDGDRYRPILYRGSLSEVITPYGDPAYTSWYPRDEGDYGLTSYSGARAQAIVGADAPENATFLPAVVADPRGQAITLDRAAAIYERDAGVLWRHAGEGRRARQLVLSAYATIDNYDYLFHWIFSQDGGIDVQVQLTGVMNVRQVDTMHEAEDSAMTSVHFGHLVAPGVEAPNHQHFFCWRLDFDVDGTANRVVELNTSNAQAMLHDTLGEWFGMEKRTLRSELEGQRDIDFSTARRWLVVNNKTMNSLGQPTAYAILPGENAPPFPSPTSAPRRRAAFLNHHLWVTRYDPAQMYASGEFVNIAPDNAGVSDWSRNDQSIVDQDVVLWYTLAVTHLPRPEDWPVMNAYTAGFRIVPVGFWGGNPVATPAR